MVEKSVFRLHPENQSHEGIAEAGRRIAKARESAGDEHRPGKPSNNVCAGKHCRAETAKNPNFEQQSSHLFPGDNMRANRVEIY